MKIGDTIWCSCHYNGSVRPVKIIGISVGGRITAKFTDGWITRDNLFPSKIEALEDEALFVMCEQGRLQEEMEKLNSTLKELQGRIYEEAT